MKIKLVLLGLVLALGLSLGVANVTKLHAKGFSLNNMGIRAAGSSSDISGTSTSTTTIGNSGAEEFHTFAVNVECTAASGLITPAVVSIGTNNPDYNNIATAVTVPTTAGIGRLVTLEAVSIVPIPEDTDVKVKVNVAAVGTTQNFKVALLGHTAFP